METLLRTREAAAALDLSPSVLEKDRLTGRLGIPFIRIGSSVRYEPKDLEAFKEARKHNQIREAA